MFVCQRLAISMPRTKLLRGNDHFAPYSQPVSSVVSGPLYLSPRVGGALASDAVYFI